MATHGKPSANQFLQLCSKQP